MVLLQPLMLSAAMAASIMIFRFMAFTLDKFAANPDST